MCLCYTEYSYLGLQKRAKGQELLDRVFEHLELVEKDYFGLQFADVPQADGEDMVCSNTPPCCVVRSVCMSGVWVDSHVPLKVDTCIVERCLF